MSDINILKDLNKELEEKLIIIKGLFTQVEELSYQVNKLYKIHKEEKLSLI